MSPVTQEEAEQFYKEIKGIADANTNSGAVLSLSEKHASFLMSASPGSAGAIITDETVPDSPKYSITATDLNTVVAALEQYAEEGPPPPEADEAAKAAKEAKEKELDKGFGKDVEKGLDKGKGKDKDEGGKGHDKHDDKEHGKGHDKHDEPDKEHKGHK